MYIVYCIVTKYISNYNINESSYHFRGDRWNQLMK